jgi:hypothetical protein
MCNAGHSMHRPSKTAGFLEETQVKAKADGEWSYKSVGVLQPNGLRRERDRLPDG